MPAVRAQNQAAPRATVSLFLPLILKNCPAQLVQDPGFEAGLPNPSWVTTSTINSAILDSSSIPSPNPTHSGSWKAWLGGNDGVQESVWQTLTIPASANSLQLSFWRRISTNESSPLTHDRLDVLIRNSAGVPLETLYTLWDGDAGTVWTQHTLTPTGNYAGQTVQIAFWVKTDSSGPTSFFIDDVTLTVFCGP